MGIKENPVNTQETRQFGFYLTSNPYLYAYLAEAGILPESLDTSQQGRTTWHYKANDDLRRLVYAFRQQESGAVSKDDTKPLPPEWKKTIEDTLAFIKANSKRVSV